MSVIDDHGAGLQELRKKVILVNCTRNTSFELIQVLYAHGIDLGYAEIGHTIPLDYQETEGDAFVIFRTRDTIDDFMIIPKLAALPSRPGIIFVTTTPKCLDRILALELGADECADSTARPIEIVARIRAIFRRRHEYKLLQLANLSINSPTSKINFNGWIFDTRSLKLTTPSGDLLPITGYEVRLISTLAHNRETVFSRDELSLICTGKSEAEAGRAVDTTISRLRRKMAKFDDSDIIESVRGRGYSFVPLTEFI